MVAEALIHQTVSRFPRFAERTVRIEPLEKGGSDRNYYRVREEPDGHSIIVVQYGDSREENRHYCAIAQFLASLDIHVPEIYFHDEAQRLIWMEDLGEEDLWSFREFPWSERRVMYASALDELAALHARAHRAAEKDQQLPLQVEFDAELYRWEQNYFLENCLIRFFGLDEEKIGAHWPRAVLDRAAETLAQKPRVLVHRDFQSQNILICNARACLIDFQGLRPGLAQYDLASLVYDPYVALEENEREELIDLYVQKSLAVEGALSPDFREVFDWCAAQRLMQALGAYGFLGLVKGRADFLDHIPAALASLCEVTARIPQMHPLRDLLLTLPQTR